METAIRKAIEGGYEIHGMILKEDNLFYSGHPLKSEIENKALLDPLFWQALGKAEGWGGKTGENDGSGVTLYGKSIQEAEWVDTWKLRWHSFIDHLAEGKDIDSFFTSLIQ